MIFEEHVNVTCPRCGKVSDTIFWKSLNAGANVPQRERLLSGDLFTFTCPSCGEQGMTDYPVLYHDDRKRFVIYYANSEKSAGEIEAVLAELRGDGGRKGLPEGYTVRVVFTPHALREKVILLENGLDDRTVEILKLLHLPGVREAYPGLDPAEILFFLDEESYGLQFIGGEKSVYARVEKSVYENVLNNITNPLAGERETGYTVDLKWAAGILKQ